MSSLLTPLNKSPTLSPASAESNCLLNVSTPVMAAFSGTFLYPTISTSSPIFAFPYSMVPATTVPLPGMVKVESIDIMKV